MTYNEFKENIKKDIASVYSGENRVIMQPVKKNNSVFLDALIIQNEKSNISPSIYLNGFFDLIKDGKPYDDILKDIINVYETYKTDLSFDTSRLLDFEYMKGKIAFKLINLNKNLELLDEVPFVRFLDLAIVFYYHIENMAGETGSILITDEMLSCLGIDLDTLYETALFNTPGLFPYTSRTISEVLASYLGNGTPCLPPDPLKMYVLSNNSCTFGACAILYPGLLEKLSEKIGENLIILPSSIHEIIYLPESEVSDINDINELIVSVNETEVSASEYLSDHCYFYNAEEKRLSF